MPESVLIVDPDTASRKAVAAAFEAAHYRTAVADDFRPAVRLLESTRPDLLITVVRLGAFNGLQLVVQGRTVNPRMAALVVDDSSDALLEQESRSLGASRYLSRPVAADELLKRAAEALAARERRAWSRTVVAGNVKARIAGRRARLLDASYSGVRLESESAFPAIIRLELPAVRLSVKAERVWSRRSATANVWLCGATLAPIDLEGRQRWRRLVDALRQASASSR